MTSTSRQRRSVKYRPLLCFLVGIAALQPGCTATSQEALQGRWYNDATSIRFQSDGTLVYNSTATGLVTGRYYFDGETRPESAASPVNNLTLDLALRDGLERWQLDLRFLGDERIRLQPISPVRRGRPSDRVAKVMILRRAADAAPETVAAAR